jgi:hypothetical protein
MCRRCSLQSQLPLAPTEDKRVTVKLRRTSYEFAQQLVRSGRYVFDERDAWSEHQPSTRAENEFIAAHGLAEYANWHLGVDDAEPDDTKAHYKFPYGDFSNAHRCALLSAESRAAQYKHFDIEAAAAHLHGMIDALQKAAKVTR